MSARHGVLREAQMGAGAGPLMPNTMGVLNMKVAA